MLTGVDTERERVAEPCPSCGGQVAASGNFCLDCGRSMPAGIVMRHRVRAERWVRLAEGEGTAMGTTGLLRRWLKRRR
jgi:hypothetical protein